MRPRNGIAQRLGRSFFVLSALASAARADVYDVDRIDDVAAANACTATPQDCSLRGAMGRANAHAGEDAISFNGLGIFRVAVLSDAAAGDLQVTDDLVVDGGTGGGVAIVGGSGWLHRVIHVSGSASLSVNDVLFSGGDTAFGGGINVSGSATVFLNRVEVSGNHAGHGAGIRCVDSCQLTLLHSTVAENVAGGTGGGIFVGTFAAVTLDRSTVSGNQAGRAGALFVSGHLEANYATLAENRTLDSAGADIEFLNPPDATLAGNVIAGDCLREGGLVPQSGGVNIESPGATCGLKDPNDRVGLPSAGLMPLDYDGGGFTLARLHRPMVLGPAVDVPFLVIPTCGSFDQRHLPRPADGDGDGDPRCDAGAVELQPSEVVFWDDFETGDTSRWSISSP